MLGIFSFMFGTINNKNRNVKEPKFGIVSTQRTMVCRLAMVVGGIGAHVRIVVVFF